MSGIRPGQLDRRRIRPGIIVVMDPSARMQRLVTGYRVSQAIHTAAVLNLSDLLVQGPLSVTDLATATGCDPRSLHRLLRALASEEVYQELPDGRYASTPLGDQLRTGTAGSQQAMAAFVGRPYTWQAWSALPHSVRTGENAFRFVHGQSSWDYRAERPDESAIFDAAMTGFSAGAATAILRAYDFGRFTTVVDVGGGRGALLAAILAQHPAVHGILFDQPHVVSDAAQPLREAGVHSRCEVVGGDMFGGVPAGGDAYVLKSILHDWEDEEVLAILAVCRRAMDSAATLIVMERLLDRADQDVTFSDLNMLVGPGGRERTAAEYAELFARAGFQLTRTVSTPIPWQVLEAAPAS